MTSSAAATSAKPEEILAAVRSDNPDRLAELLDVADAGSTRLKLLNAAVEASAAGAARLLLEDELERCQQLPEPLVSLAVQSPSLATWALLAAARAGRLDALEQLLSAELPEQADASLWRQLSGCLAKRHPATMLDAIAGGRCPRLLGRLLPEAIEADDADLPLLSAAERQALEADASELLPARLRPLLLRVEPTQSDSRALARAAVASGSAELVRHLLRFGQLRPEHLVEHRPDELVPFGHLELAGEMLLLPRPDLLHCCLDLRAACENQLKRLPPAASPLLSQSRHQDDSRHRQVVAMSPESLCELRDFAELVCLNAVDQIYATCPPSCQPLVHHHLLRPPPSGVGACLAKKSPESFFATRCFVELVDRRWRRGAYPSSPGRRCSNLASPREKFLLHAAALLVFMALHAFYIIQLDSRWRWTDSLMVVYFISYSLQELHELLRTGKQYFNIWNLIDQLQLLFHLLGLAFKTALVAGAADAGQLLYVCRLLLGVSFMFCGLKFVLKLRAYQKFGPFINMMKALFWADLLPFLVAMFFFLVVCSGVFFHALLTPGNQLYTASGSVLRVNQTQLYWDIYLRPLLLAFGELRYDSLAGCLDGEDNSQGCPHPNGLRAYTGGLMHVYLIVVNLLLINLLIAKFSLTVSVKDANGFVTWRRYRYQLLLEFEVINTLPPPVNVPSILLDWLLRCLAARPAAAAGRSNATADEDDGVELRATAAGADGPRYLQDAAASAFKLVQAVALRTPQRRRETLRRERGAGVFTEE
ncbi:hypothetical protein BOX15_Mlig011463g1 [Macrostomum lignano]|uniref:Ion transport domain-containing protein n=1 Tax=Macrostomum lignano TaxID=282301 RepID=A0A267FHV9_9PLAT|nr:hypothetical protein BOX15_Mlig011463g1 [Macrostomum lignano]